MTTTEVALRLFDVAAIPQPERGSDAYRDLSTTARRTARHRADLAVGRHPFGGPVRPDLGTCGTCVNLRCNDRGRRRYYKCALAGITNGGATDLRLGWPACNLYAPAPPEAD